jgi:hypothetical protein
MGSQAYVATNNVSQPKTTAGASSPILEAGAALGNSGTTVTGGTLDNSTKTTFGNNTVINPDQTPLISSALDSLGSALNTAISNRDVIAPSPNATVTQTGTQTPTTGTLSTLAGGVTSWLNSGGLKIALIVAFPLLALGLWWLLRKKK